MAACQWVPSQRSTFVLPANFVANDLEDANGYAGSGSRMTRLPAGRAAQPPPIKPRFSLQRLCALALDAEDFFDQRGFERWIKIRDQRSDCARRIAPSIGIGEISPRTLQSVTKIGDP